MMLGLYLFAVACFLLVVNMFTRRGVMKWATYLMMWGALIASVTLTVRDLA